PSTMRGLRAERFDKNPSPAWAEPESPLLKKKAITAEATALSDNHSLRAAIGNLHLGSNSVGLVQDVRCCAGRNAGQCARIRQDRSSRREARAWRVPACQR